MVKRVFFLATLTLCRITMAAESSVDDRFDWNAPVAVKSLPYGNVLFEYYRGNTFEAIRALEVANEKKQLKSHVTEAQALLGSMQLSYGMLVESEKALTGAMQDKLPTAVKEQVMMSLARVRYRAGDNVAALARLNQLTSITHPLLRDDAALMKANIYLREQQPTDAARALADVKADSASYRYALFNLGVALLQSRQTAQAESTFASLLQLPASAEIEKALRDRTLLAQGYDLLRQQQAEPAILRLRQIRLNGPYANNAMLGLGWAYSRQQNYQDAIAPWQVLAQRSAADLAVQEGRLALPYALQQLGALAESLTAYGDALSSFDVEIGKIDGALKSLRDGETLRNLLARLPEHCDTASTDDVVLAREGEQVYLGRVLTSHEFNASFHRYQALRQMRDNLADWQRRLPIYQNMLDNHQRRFGDRVPQVDARLAQIDVATQGERINRLREQVETAKDDNNWTALLNEKERETLARLERIQARIERISHQQPVAPTALEKYRLLRATFMFDISRVAKERQWQMQRELRDTEVALRRLNAQRARLLSARDVASERFSNYQNKIDGMQQRVMQFSQRSEGDLAQEEKRLIAIAENELQRWRKQLTDYRYQAQLAVARLQDRASRGDQP